MIPSFKVDHTKLKPGLYVSRVDKWGLETATTFDTRVYDANGEEVELKQDLDDGTGIQPIDDKAFTTVNDFDEGSEGFGIENAEEAGEEAGADAADSFADLFANALDDDSDDGADA